MANWRLLAVCLNKEKSRCVVNFICSLQQISVPSSESPTIYISMQTSVRYVHSRNCQNVGHN